MATATATATTTTTTTVTMSKEGDKMEVEDAGDERREERQ